MYCSQIVMYTESQSYCQTLSYTHLYLVEAPACLPFYRRIRVSLDSWGRNKEIIVVWMIKMRFELVSQLTYYL